MGVLRRTEERMSITEDPPPLHQTLPQTATPVWNESASFLIRKPNTEILELQVLQTHPPHLPDCCHSPGAGAGTARAEIKEVVLSCLERILLSGEK